MELSFFALIKKPELLKIILDNKLIDENNLTALNLKKQNIITAIIECDKLKNIDSLLKIIDSYPNNKDIYKTLLSVDNLANINELLKNLTNKEQVNKYMRIFAEKANY